MCCHILETQNNIIGWEGPPKVTESKVSQDGDGYRRSLRAFSSQDLLSSSMNISQCPWEICANFWPHHWQIFLILSNQNFQCFGLFLPPLYPLEHSSEKSLLPPIRPPWRAIFSSLRPTEGVCSGLWALLLDHRPPLQCTRSHPSLTLFTDLLRMFPAMTVSVPVPGCHH